MSSNVDRGLQIKKPPLLLQGVWLEPSNLISLLGLTQYAVFNNLRSKKTSIVYPDFGHEHLPGFADSVFHFLTFTD